MAATATDAVATTCKPNNGKRFVHRTFKDFVEHVRREEALRNKGGSPIKQPAKFVVHQSLATACGVDQKLKTKNQKSGLRLYAYEMQPKAGVASGGARFFFWMKQAEFYRISEKLLPEQRCFHEVLVHDAGFYLFFDIDAKTDLESNDQTTLKILLNKFVTWFGGKIAPMQHPSIGKLEYYVHDYDASNDVYLSRHVVFSNFGFHQMANMKVFVDKLKMAFRKNEEIQEYCADNDVDIEQFLNAIDMSPYRENGQFRLPLSSNTDGQRPLELAAQYILRDEAASCQHDVDMIDEEKRTMFTQSYVVIQPAGRKTTFFADQSMTKLLEAVGIAADSLDTVEVDDADVKDVGNSGIAAGTVGVVNGFVKGDTNDAKGKTTKSVTSPNNSDQPGHAVEDPDVKASSVEADTVTLRDGNAEMDRKMFKSQQGAAVTIEKVNAAIASALAAQGDATTATDEQLFQSQSTTKSSSTSSPRNRSASTSADADSKSVAFDDLPKVSLKRSRSVSPPGLNQLKADVWRSLAQVKSQSRKTSKVTAKNKPAASVFIQMQSKDAGDVSNSSCELDTDDSGSPNSSDRAFIKDTPSTSQSSQEARKRKALKRKRRSSSSSSQNDSKRAKIKKEKEKRVVRRNVIQSDSGSSQSASPAKMANLDLSDNQNVPFDGDIALIATKSLEDKRLDSDRILFGNGEDLANASATVSSKLGDTSNRVSTVENLKSSAFGSISVAYATSSEDEDALLAAADLADQHLRELESQKVLDLTKNEPTAVKAIVFVSSASLSQEKPRTFSSNVGTNTVQTSSAMKQATANRSAKYRSWTASRNNYGDAKFHNLIKPTLVFPKVVSQRLPITQTTTNEGIGLSPQALTLESAQLIPSIKLSQGTSTSTLKNNGTTLLQATSAQADISASFQVKLPESQLYKTGDVLARVFDRKEDIRDKQRSSTLTIDHFKSFIDKEQHTPINQLEKLKPLPSDLSRDRGFSGRAKQTSASTADPIKDGKKVPLSLHKSLPRQKQTSADADYEADSEMSDD